MSEIGFALSMILMGCLGLLHGYYLDSKKNIYEGRTQDEIYFLKQESVRYRYFSFYIIILGMILIAIEIPNILSPKWVSLISLATGLLLCVGAVALGMRQYKRTEELYITRKLTAQERRRDNSQYAYIGLSLLFVMGLLMIILNLQ